MLNEATKYFMGDVYVGDEGFGFLVSDSREGQSETAIDDTTAHAIVTTAKGKVDAPLKPANLFEISQDEFERFRDTEIASPGLAEGLKVWQVKK